MGRDKVAKPSPPAAGAAPPPAPIIGLNGRPLVPRGHKQKGAGTVITDKGPIVTSDGIVLKSHERLPCQLLQEFCQREKRPMPQYEHRPPGNRYNVLLADVKNSKNDISFCPVQNNFESGKVAKDMGALLALFHFQKSLPLERKMPEPYCTTWLEMLAADKAIVAGTSAASTSTAPTGKSSGAAAAAAALAASSSATAATSTASSGKKPAGLTSAESATNSKKAGGGGSVAMEIVIDKATADWLCVQCNAQNFATFADGRPRVKCFKCQSLKTDTCEYIATVSSMKALAAAPSATSTAASSSSSSATTTTSATAGAAATADVVKVRKAPPAAVVGLRSSAPSITRAEVERINTEKIALRNKKRSYFDALRRSNKPPAVLLSPPMRRMLEAALGLTSAPAFGQAANGASASDSDDAVASLDAFITDVEARTGGADLSGCEGLGFLSESETRLSPKKQIDMLRRIAAKLQEHGFSEGAVVAALRNISENTPPDTVLDELEPNSADSSQETTAQIGRLETLFLDASLEFLCLQFDDDALPEQFDARSNESMRQLEVVKKKEAALSDEQQRLVDELAQCGWANADLATAIRTPFSWSSDKSLDVLVLLHNATQQTMGDGAYTFQAARSTDEVPTEFSAAFMAEIETLSSIYDSQLSVLAPNTESADFYRLALTLDSSRFRGSKGDSKNPLHSGTTSLEMLVHPRMRYPRRPPLFLVKNKAAATASPQLLLSIQCAVWSRAQQCCLEGQGQGEGEEDSEGDQEGFFYQVASFLEEELAKGASVSTHTSAPLSLQSSLARVASGERLQTSSSSSSLSSSSPSSAVTTNVSSSSSVSSASTFSTTTSSLASSSTAKERQSHPFWSTNGPSTRRHFTEMEIGNFVASDPEPAASNSGSRMDGAKYAKMLRGRQALPAWKARANFLEAILSSDVRGMVVTGETGCGKTTQIPQFINECHRNARIVVCQPRRLAAVGVATRVAEEMAVPIGDEVGYMVRGDSKATNRTRMVFCTYGVLLRRLQEDPDLLAIDYVILDEVHERGLESDFALALLVAALQRGKSKLKIILMSATISTGKFANYLGAAMRPPAITNSQQTGPTPAPVLHIPGFTYPVYEFYKADFESLLRHTVAPTDGKTTPGSAPAPAPVVENWEEAPQAQRENAPIGGRKRKGDIDYDLLVRLVMFLAVGINTKGNSGSEGPPMLSRATGSVLVFMPGVPEISRFMSLLQQTWPNRELYLPRAGRSDDEQDVHLKILALHGNLSPGDQKKVFEPAERNELKIVVATNVAEASVTIPDVTVVVDSCRVKEMDYDGDKQMAALVMKMASQDSLRQRRGRAGRVQEGRCFRTITVGTYTGLPANSIPEMLRAPLDRLVLQIKSMNLRETCMQLLRRCPDAPSRTSVEFAEASLTRIQALDGDGVLTPLGRHLAALPCAPKVGRLLVFGSLLSCTYPTSCVAAYLTSRSPFQSAAEPEARQRVDAARAHFARSTGNVRSDHMIIVAALQQFNECNGQSDKRRFCRDYALSYERMLEIQQLQSELLDGIVSLGFVSSTRDALRLSHSCNGNSDKPNVVAAALCAGLYPQLAKILRPPKRFVEVMGSALERDVVGKELKFFIPEHPDDVVSTSAIDDICTQGMQRVFIHPSSINFSNASFRASPFVLYGERAMSPNVLNPQAYLRDTTEVTAFPLLFFGGKLEANYLEGSVTVDSWIKFSAPGRLVALVQALRKAVDNLLTRKISDPSLDLSSSPELAAACRLLAMNGGV